MMAADDNHDDSAPTAIAFIALALQATVAGIMLAALIWYLWTGTALWPL